KIKAGSKWACDLYTRNSCSTKLNLLMVRHSEVDMRAIYLSCLLLLATNAHGLAMNCPDGPVIPALPSNSEMDGTLLFQRGNWTAHLHWLTKPLLNADSELQVVWAKQDGVATFAPAKFQVRLCMPAMGHGSRPPADPQQIA